VIFKQTIKDQSKIDRYIKDDGEFSSTKKKRNNDMKSPKFVD
jgi:hypothetical protein